jgi:pectinacetylesterase
MGSVKRFLLTVALGALPIASLTQACSSSSSGAQDTSGDGGKGTLVPCVADESAPVPARCTTDPNDTSLPQCNTWIKVEIPGTVCSDGSQYKFFVNYSNTSNDVEINFEPGGACWDYESCSGAGGVRGAANPNGIPDDHMSDYQYLNLLRRSDINPAQNYNMVFVSYCTGDVHFGDNVVTYLATGGDGDGGAAGDTSDAGETGDGGPASITYRHAGHANVLAVVDWVQKAFPVVPRLFVTGCSAGGAGALLNYPFIRDGLGSNVQCSYLLDDSGPIFHSNGPSMQLDQTIRASWNTDAVMATLDGKLPIDVPTLESDYGLINTAIAQKYPHDRLSVVAYRMDLNYSLYSYQRFFPGSTEAQIHAFWWQDLQALMATYDTQANLAYYLPFFRSDNCSHCVSIPPLGNPPLVPTDEGEVLSQPWNGSGIAADMIDLEQYTQDLLDDTKPLNSYVESQQNEDFTPAIAAQCMEGG